MKRYILLITIWLLTLGVYAAPNGDFISFLKAFNRDYANSKANLEKYIHEEIGVYTGNNPGVMCIATQSHEFIRHVEPEIFDNPVFSDLPKGDFCEGYPGVKDGFYYESINTSKLPVFDSYDENGEYTKVHINIPEHTIEPEMYKVTVIKDQYHLCYFYFISLEGGQWYLMCQDFCDCSA